MYKLKSIKTLSTEQTVAKKALIFGLTSVILYGIGFGLTTPVVPFLVQPYVSSPENQAMVIALLTFIYAVCVLDFHSDIFARGSFRFSANLFFAIRQRYL